MFRMQIPKIHALFLMACCVLMATMMPSIGSAAGAKISSTEIVHVPLFIMDKDGNVPSDPSEPLFEVRKGNPILASNGQQFTFADFMAPQGKVTVECIDAGTHVGFNVTGLIPNGLYTAWSVVFKSPGFTPDFEHLIGLGTLGPTNGNEGVFTASATGEGELTTIVPTGDLSMQGDIGRCALTDEYEYHVVGAYHLDGQSHGADLGPDGTAVELFAWIFKAEDFVGPTPVKPRGKLTTTWAKLKTSK